MTYYVRWRMSGYPSCWRAFENAGVGMGQYMLDVVASGVEYMTVDKDKPSFPSCYTLTDLMAMRGEERKTVQSPVRAGKGKTFNELLEDWGPGGVVFPCVTHDDYAVLERKNKQLRDLLEHMREEIEAALR